MIDINVRGISAFFFWAIPAILGLAGIYWLVVIRGFFEVRKGMVMDSRHNEIVGAKPLPRGAIEISLVDVDTNGPVIQRAEIRGADLTVWVRNDGDTTVGEIGRSIKIEWKAISPDGTIVSSGTDYCSWDVALKPQQVTECAFSINADRRMKRLELAIRN